MTCEVVTLIEDPSVEISVETSAVGHPEATSEVISEVVSVEASEEDHPIWMVVVVDLADHPKWMAVVVDLADKRRSTSMTKKNE